MAGFSRWSALGGAFHLEWRRTITEYGNERLSPVPTIKPVAERLELHRVRSGNLDNGRIFCHTSGRHMSMNNLINCVIRPQADSRIRFLRFHAERLELTCDSAYDFSPQPESRIPIKIHDPLETLKRLW